MKYCLTALTAISLVASVIAQPINHVHHAHKRDAEPEPVNEYVTVQVTQFVTANGAAPTTTAPAPAATSDVAAAPVVNAVANNSPDAGSPGTTLVTVASSTAAAGGAASTPSSAPASSGSNGSPGGSSGSSGAFGLSYSPYTSSGDCKTAGEVQSDLAQLTGFNVIRIYGTDCNQVANVLNALAPGQQLFVGIFDMGSIPSELQTIHDACNGDYSRIHTISIGNELVNSGQASPSQVGAFVSQARGILGGLGYTGPIVAVDTFIAVINNPELCQYSDYMAVNAHAFFDGGVTADQAGSWALQQIQRVYSACSGSKSVLISESGWPSQGESNGVAVPSPANLQAAISSLKGTIGNDVILFSAFNDLWKAPGYLDVEQYWGILDS
jgi:exo-beta-1,3-glucanase (GH17 family)